MPIIGLLVYIFSIVTVQRQQDQQQLFVGARSQVHSTRSAISHSQQSERKETAIQCVEDAATEGRTGENFDVIRNLLYALSFYLRMKNDCR